MTDTTWIMRVNWHIPRAVSESGRKPFASSAWKRLTELHTKRASDLRRTRDIHAFVALHDAEHEIEKEAIQDVLRWPLILDMHQAGLLISTKIVAPNVSHGGIGSRFHIVKLAAIAGANRSTARKVGECFGDRGDELGIPWHIFEHRMRQDEDTSTFEDVQRHPPTGWVLSKLDKDWVLDTDLLMIYADADDFSDEIRREGGL